MLSGITETALRDPATFFGVAAAPASIAYIGVLGSPMGGTTMFLAVPEGASRPAYAVKIYRDDATGERAEHEAAILRALAGTPVAASAPRVLSVRRGGGSAACVQSAVGGRPMPPRRGSDGLPDADEAERRFDVVSRWCADLHRSTRVTAGTADRADDAGGIVDDLASAFDLDADERAYLDALRADLGRLAPPRAVAHGDLTWHNVLVRRDGISVVDWSDASWAAPPLQDLFLFVTTFAHHTRRGRGRESFVAAFDAAYFGAGRYATVVARALRDHCDRVGVDRGLLEPLFGSFLATRAARELRRARASAAGALPRLSHVLAAGSGDPVRAQVWALYLRSFVQRRARFLAA